MSPFSKSNEVRAWQYVSFLAREALDQFPTTLKQDREMLQQDVTDNKLSEN